ncbi:acyl-CoA dehydrogenase-like protein [Streptomyces sp. 846.5]|nr:acyl-CoA dehydrogenase [Streptomyces sp. 846.5]TDU04689.1 acyl-CoA dehydrogenase-like protein [Streptomyces sp. 846.5]
MDFRLTDDQIALQLGLRELLTGRFGPEQLRTAMTDSDKDRLPLWSELADAGLFSLRKPEQQEGGLGLGLAEAVLAFEEVGRALVPGPLVATELATVHASLPLHQAAGLCRNRPAGRGPLLVERLPTLDTLLLADTVTGEVQSVSPARVRARSRRGVDPLTPLWELEGPLPSGDPLPGLDARRLWVEGSLLTAALQVGVASRAVATAVVYAGQREQFGQPIGAFQAVQHLCADMLARTEPARAAVRAAAVCADAGASTAELAVATAGAKLLADQAAVRGARDCLQVHGGMGFTWEADVHLLLKRAWVYEGSFAGAAESTELLAEDLSAAAVGHL